jgi:hypothetical protein
MKRDSVGVKSAEKVSDKITGWLPYTDEPIHLAYKEKSNDTALLKI